MEQQSLFPEYMDTILNSQEMMEWRDADDFIAESAAIYSTIGTPNESSTVQELINIIARKDGLKLEIITQKRDGEIIVSENSDMFDICSEHAEMFVDRVDGLYAMNEEWIPENLLELWLVREDKNKIGQKIVTGSKKFLAIVRNGNNSLDVKYKYLQRYINEIYPKKRDKVIAKSDKLLRDATLIDDIYQKDPEKVKMYVMHRPFGSDIVKLAKEYPWTVIDITRALNVCLNNYLGTLAKILESITDVKTLAANMEKFLIKSPFVSNIKLKKTPEEKLDIIIKYHLLGNMFQINAATYMGTAIDRRRGINNSVEFLRRAFLLESRNIFERLKNKVVHKAVRLDKALNAAILFQNPNEIYTKHENVLKGVGSVIFVPIAKMAGYELDNKSALREIPINTLLPDERPFGEFTNGIRDIYRNLDMSMGKFLTAIGAPLKQEKREIDYYRSISSLRERFKEQEKIHYLDKIHEEILGVNSFIHHYQSSLMNLYTDGADRVVSSLINVMLEMGRKIQNSAGQSGKEKAISGINKVEKFVTGKDNTGNEEEQEF